jgi:SAM-dependent methyltransferase
VESCFSAVSGILDAFASLLSPDLWPPVDYNQLIENQAQLMLRSLLAHPVTRGRSIDDPATTDLRRFIVTSKPFLRAIYEDWYRAINERVPPGGGSVLELGSGGGFLELFLPGLITSEVFKCSAVQLVADAQQLPFPSGSLRAIVMTNVLHHIPDAALFFQEATRCLRPGGVVVMVEPWVSSWSRLVYTHLHHEPFDSAAPRWHFPAQGPLSDANGALPWVVFARDRKRFESEFPSLRIEEIKPMMPFRYLVSGGVSMRTLMPNFTTSWWRAIEKACQPLMNNLAMFSLISLKRI